MKVYKVEVLVIDHDNLGPGGIKETLENTRYPNWCMSPHVMLVEGREIGEWSDDNALNSSHTMHEEYQRLFGEKA